MFKRKKGLVDSQDDFYKASKDLIEANWFHFKTPTEKIRKMEAIYFAKNPDLYTDEQKKLIHSHLEALLFKFEIASYALEQLWSIREAKTLLILDTIGNGTITFDISNEDLFLYSSLLEQFLFQGRAFLDFYMFYVAVLFKQGEKNGNMSHSKFLKAMKNASDTQFDKKAEEVRIYFKENVFGNGKWGALIKGLRDKISHRDKINHSFDSVESLFDGTRIDIPTLRKTTYDRFCQDVQNGMFELYQTIMPILYDLEWQAGQYKEGMWEQESK